MRTDSAERELERRALCLTKDTYRAEAHDHGDNAVDDSADDDGDDDDYDDDGDHDDDDNVDDGVDDGNVGDDTNGDDIAPIARPSALFDIGNCQ